MKGVGFVNISRNFIRRGDVYFADLTPVQGSEQGGVRPVVVIQNNIGNRYSPTVVVAVITSKGKVKLPTHVVIKDGGAPMLQSVVLLEQIRTIDKCRLRQYVSTLSTTTMQRINAALGVSIGLEIANTAYEKLSA